MAKSYPNKMQLKPGSQEHGKILSEIAGRFQESSGYMSQRYPIWNIMDDTLKVFVNADDAEKLEDRNLTSPIVIPMSYATLQTLLTYVYQVFNQDPLFRYTGITGQVEDDISAKLLELVVHNNFKKMHMDLALHTCARDSFVYGMGVITPSWINTFRTKRTSGGVIDQLVFEGNKLYNIDPYNYFPDPGTSIANIQDAEYIGFIEETNLSSLLAKQESGELFNVNFISTNGSAYIGNRRSSRSKSKSRGLTYSNSVDVLHMYVRIIPKDWKVGRGSSPEWWLFSVANESVVINVEPVELDHGGVPIVAGAPDYDGYDVSPVSRIEQIQGIQDAINWSFSTHIASVRKSLNDMIVVDPFMINMKDLEDPRPGKLIRLRRRAFGQDIKKSISQLEVRDVTQGHVNDSLILNDIMQRVSAASDIVQGYMHSKGESRSASEVNNATRAALSRIDKDVNILISQVIEPLGLMLASNVVQFMSQDLFLRSIGEHKAQLERLYGVPLEDAVSISPGELNINYDISLEDTYNMSSAGVQDWIFLFQTIMQSPELNQGFDIFRIFSLIARKLGARNIEQFRRVVQETPVDVQPTQQVQQEVQAGNLVPLEEGM